MEKKLSLTLKTPPKKEPITRKEAKLHLRVDNDLTEDDALIDDMIRAARGSGQVFTRRQFITATYEARMDAFPPVIELPRPPSVNDNS